MLQRSGAIEVIRQLVNALNQIFGSFFQVTCLLPVRSDTAPDVARLYLLNQSGFIKFVCLPFEQNRFTVRGAGINCNGIL